MACYYRIIFTVWVEFHVALGRFGSKRTLQQRMRSAGHVARMYAVRLHLFRLEDLKTTTWDTCRWETSFILCPNAIINEKIDQACSTHVRCEIPYKRFRR